MELDASEGIREDDGRKVIGRIRGAGVVVPADLLAGIAGENRHWSIEAGVPEGDEALRASAYVPEAEDVVRPSLDPRSGHERRAVAPRWPWGRPTTIASGRSRGVRRRPR